MKILVVDDELVSRKKMERIIRRYGDCQAVASGSEAIQAYTEALAAGKPFGLITLDISMPDMEGTQVLSTIRRVERHNAIAKADRVKILMVTSHADHETVMTSIQSGCDDYIKKPFSLERVTRKLEEMGVAPLMDPSAPSGIYD
jgi:two-component system, chemotaxis family, chemotaxis protein CheY